MAQSATRVSGYLTPPPGTVFGSLLALMIIFFVTVSAYVLIESGWNYGETGGSPLEKIHPATLLAAFILLLTACTFPNPLVPLVNGFADYPNVVLYLVTVALVMVHALFVVGLPFTVFIDTFIGPALVFLLLSEIDERRRRRLAWLVHALFLANTLLGLAEFGLGFRLTPLHVEGETLEEEWRASAFIGHPLSNAMLTGSYMVLLLSGGARDLPTWLKPVLFLIAGAGMVVFGERAATRLIVLFVAWHVLRRAMEVLSGKPFDPILVLIGLIGHPVLAGGVLVLADQGFFDFVHSMMRHYGLDYGIESFWVSDVLSHGLIMSCVFFFGLFLFCVEVVRARPSGLAVMLYFFAVASASLSLSAKSQSFSVLILMVMVLLPMARRPEAMRREIPLERDHRAGRAPIQVA